MKSKFIHDDVGLEEAIVESGSESSQVLELQLGNSTLVMLGCGMALAIFVIFARLVQLNVNNSIFYQARAQANFTTHDRLPAPRGLITDRFGVVLAQNAAVFEALLDIKEFLRGSEGERQQTLEGIQTVLNISADDVNALLQERKRQGRSDPIVISSTITQNQIVQLASASFVGLHVVPSFKRQYPFGEQLAHVLGYASVANAQDLQQRTDVVANDLVGKLGIEAQYDTLLQGTPGVSVNIHDAKGHVVAQQQKSTPRIGASLELTIDNDLQSYFYNRLQTALHQLGRTTAVGIALNPTTGEVLSLISIPSFDNNIFSVVDTGSQRQTVLTSPAKPLFNRAISGLYTAGSTIKPLVGIAALHEGVISPQRQIFSPGYLDIPNPYNPSKPSRFLDWRYQGNVNLAAAIAKSSNVYFYSVGGGANGISGLGISRLREWWKKFHLGSLTGIDIPGEVSGFLPSPEWKQKTKGVAWLLGDTFNVSIGQGDLLMTPLQIINYIASVANGGTLYKPTIAKTGHDTPEVLADLTSLNNEMSRVQEGMRQTVVSPEGTAYLLHDLPFAVAGKTGSAQVNNNTQENAFFVGYAPYEHPQIALLVLVEHAKQGSLNAVPVAKDVLQWYYEHRINAHE